MFGIQWFNRDDRLERIARSLEAIEARLATPPPADPVVPEEFELSEIDDQVADDDGHDFADGLIGMEPWPQVWRAA